MYKIRKSTFDHITMKAKAITENNKDVIVHGTYAFGPQLNWYDETNECWVNTWEFIYGAPRTLQGEMK